MTTTPDIPHLLAGLSATPTIFREFIRTIPGDRLDLRRGDGFWTIAEHVSHLAQVQPMLLERFERFMREEHPVFVPFIPGSKEDEPASPRLLVPEEAIEQFDDYRRRQLTLLDSASGAVWRRTATHPEYDHYSLHILARHVLMHDHWHMYRMEELWLTRDAYLTRLE